MFFRKTKLENLIIKELSSGPLQSQELVDNVSKNAPATFQGVYKSLKKLLKQEVISKQGKMISLSNAWIESMSTLSEEITQNYHRTEISDFLKLEDGEKIVYSFNDTLKLDIYWMHIFILFSKKTTDPIFFFNPHQWFYLIRRKSESTLFDWINRNKRLTYMLLGGNTALDQQTQKDLSSENIHIHLDEAVSLPRNRYVGVIGDYIFSTVYSKSLQETIDNFYNTKETPSQEDIEQLRKNIISKTRAKIIVERNKAKAQKTKRRITKDLFIPKDVRERYLKP